ncbi:organomercurial lyase [Herbiconiux ginsengi]|nr:organomercurial lyase [Herbiconiux ginsengi]
MLTDLSERTRFAIYTHLARHGALPDPEQLARNVGITGDEYQQVLVELAETRNVVLSDGDIEMAHPFATRSFGFSVMGPDTLWWGGCAWDAFAIPNLVPTSPSVLVATTCPACATAHAWTVTNQGPPAGDQVAHFLTPVDRIWPNAAHACENQLIFCNESCVNGWLNRTGNNLGYVMSLETLWRLATHWYDGRLDTPYIRREPAAAADYFYSVGLRGSFWGLADERPSVQGRS